jgi:hypothetical protein
MAGVQQLQEQIAATAMDGGSAAIAGANCCPADKRDLSHGGQTPRVPY